MPTRYADCGAGCRARRGGYEWPGFPDTVGKENREKAPPHPNPLPHFVAEREKEDRSTPKAALGRPFWCSQDGVPGAGTGACRELNKEGGLSPRIEQMNTDENQSSPSDEETGEEGGQAGRAWGLRGVGDGAASGQDLCAGVPSMLRNEDEALDMSQDAWVKGWQRLAQFQGDSSFGTWMTRVVINLCLDQLRRRKRQRTESLEAMDEESGGVERRMPVVTTNPTERLERAELRQRIDPGSWSQLSVERIGRCWCCMNLKTLWNTKKSPGRWGVRWGR